MCEGHAHSFLIQDCRPIIMNLMLYLHLIEKKKRKSHQREQKPLKP